MAEQDDVVDRFLRRQTRMIRVANGVSKRALTMLAEADAVIEAYVARRLAHFPRRGLALARTVRARLQTIVVGAAKRSRRAFRAIVALLRSEVVDVAKLEADLAGRDVGVAGPGRAELRALVGRAPLVEGAPFGKAIERVAGLHRDAIERGVRAGVSLGEAGPAIVRRVFGDGGATERVRRALDALVHDALGRASAVARDVVYGLGTRAGIVRGYVWLATLDHKTCLRCVNRAKGGPYEHGRGPTPPEHSRCRCGTAPLLVGLPDPDAPDYEAWLRRQTAETQLEVLGRTRRDLWRSGKVRLDRFVNDRNRILTLDELARREGLAIDRQAA